MAIIGFARVSTDDQDLTLQLEALRAAGCDKIFYGKHSGATNENQQQLARLVDYIRDGDVVLVTKLDRLGRSLKMILSAIDNIHAKQATLKCLDGMIDTSNNSPIATAIVNLIATFAQLERDLIVSRTSEGRARAIAEGKHVGRKPSLNKKQIKSVLSELKQKIPVRLIALKHDTSRGTVYRIRDKYIKPQIGGD